MRMLTGFFVWPDGPHRVSPARLSHSSHATYTTKLQSQWQNMRNKQTYVWDIYAYACRTVAAASKSNKCNAFLHCLA